MCRLNRTHLCGDRPVKTTRCSLSTLEEKKKEIVLYPRQSFTWESTLYDLWPPVWPYQTRRYLHFQYSGALKPFWKCCEILFDSQRQFDRIVHWRPTGTTMSTSLSFIYIPQFDTYEVGGLKWLLRERVLEGVTFAAPSCKSFIHLRDQWTIFYCSIWKLVRSALTYWNQKGSIEVNHSWRI